MLNKVKHLEILRFAQNDRNTEKKLKSLCLRVSVFNK